MLTRKRRSATMIKTFSLCRSSSTITPKSYWEQPVKHLLSCWAARSVLIWYCKYHSLGFFQPLQAPVSGYPCLPSLSHFNIKPFLSGKVWADLSPVETLSSLAEKSFSPLCPWVGIFQCEIKPKTNSNFIRLYFAMILGGVDGYAVLAYSKSRFYLCFSRARSHTLQIYKVEKKRRKFSN